MNTETTEKTTGYDREEMREFFAGFWSNPENVAHFKKGAAMRGNVGRLKAINAISTEEDFQEMCRETGMPYLNFVVSTDSQKQADAEIMSIT